MLPREERFRVGAFGRCLGADGPAASRDFTCEQRSARRGRFLELRAERAALLFGDNDRGNGTELPQRAVGTERPPGTASREEPRSVGSAHPSARRGGWRAAQRACARRAVARGGWRRRVLRVPRGRVWPLPSVP